MSTGEGTSMAAKLEEVLQAVRNIESKVDDKLSAMKREMESANDRLVKKMRLDNRPTFKKRGHEKQHQFNEQVRDKDNAATSAADNSDDEKRLFRAEVRAGRKLKQKIHYCCPTKFRPVQTCLQS